MSTTATSNRVVIIFRYSQSPETVCLEFDPQSKGYTINGFPNLESARCLPGFLDASLINWDSRLNLEQAIKNLVLPTCVTVKNYERGRILPTTFLKTILISLNLNHQLRFFFAKMEK